MGSILIKGTGKKVTIDGNVITIKKAIGKDIQFSVESIDSINYEEGQLKRVGKLFIEYTDDRELKKENISFDSSYNDIVEEVVKGISSYLDNPESTLKINEKDKVGYFEQMKREAQKDLDNKNQIKEEKKARLAELDRKGIPYCPKCHSTSIHAEKRGWKVTTGLIGSNKIVVTCLNCGHKFKPGKSK